MTDIGNRRPAPAVVASGVAPIAGTGSTTLLMSAASTNGVVGQSSSAAFLQPNINGISPNYVNAAIGSATAGISPSSSGQAMTASGATNDQQRKQQTAFIVLPVSFRMAPTGSAGLSQPQIQQNSAVHSGSVLNPSPVAPATAKVISHQQTFSPHGSTDSFSPQRPPLPSDQAVKTAVNWIVQDAKQRQQQIQPIPQPPRQQQIHHRNNGKLLGPPLASPAAVAIKRATEGNLRKFSTSTAQNEERYFTFDIPAGVSHSEPNTPHPYYSPAPDGMPGSAKMIPAPRSVISDTVRRIKAGVAEPLNGSTPSPAGVNDIAAGVSTGMDVWSPSSRPNFVNAAEDVRRSESIGDVGTFIADGIYHEPDLALSTHAPFPGMITSPSAVLMNSENGTPLHQSTAISSSSSMLISPTASTISETASSATPPGNNNNRTVQPKTAGGKSGKNSGGGAFCAFEERQCKQRCINGYRHCIRHILCDPTSPYRPCNYVKKQGAKEIRCSNAVALSQGSEYCSTHLIMMGMKEAKRRKVSVPATPGSVANAAQQKSIGSDEMTERPDPETPSAAPAPKKKKAAAKKSQNSTAADESARRSMEISPNVYQQPSGHENEQVQYASPDIQYQHHQEQRIYASHSQQQYGQQQESPHQHPQSFLINGDDGNNNGAGIRSELPATSSIMNNGVHGPGFMQQSHQTQMAAEFHRPYFMEQPQPQPQYEMNYQGLQPYQQQPSSYQPMPPQPMYVAQPQQHHEYVIATQQQQPPPPPYVCNQPDQRTMQVVYEHPQQPQDTHSYSHQYSTIIVQQPPPPQQQQPYDQMPMPPPPSVLSLPDGSGSMIANAAPNGRAYVGTSGEYMMDVSTRAPNIQEQNGGHGPWKASPVAYNNSPLRSPQKAMAPVSGPTMVLCENGSSVSNSDLVRSHPELAAHLLNSSGSAATSPQSRRYSSSSGGGGNGSAAGYPQQVSHQQQPQQQPQQRQLSRSSFQAQQQMVEPFDDSGQGFGATARGHTSYLLSGDDPFLGASSSSGFPGNGSGSNTNMGAPAAAMGVVMLSPVSSELSVDSPRSITVVAASTGANAGVGLVSASAGLQYTKPSLPTYVYPAAATGVRFSTDYQSQSPLVQSIVTLDGGAHVDQRSSQAIAASTSVALNEKMDVSATDAPPAPTQPSAAPTNKKVIRLKQKKRHLRMVGPYRQIPAVSHMCKILEDLDFDRKDLFPLGLEPSSSDTDSDDECGTDLIRRSLSFIPVGDVNTAEKNIPVIDDSKLQSDAEELRGSILSSSVVSRARRQLYLLKKTLRLDENRIRRRVTTEARVVATASRLYPNSVGAALCDRRRHRTRALYRRRFRFWQPSAPNDSKKIYPNNHAARKPAPKAKKNATNMPDLDADAELELKRILTPRRCVFETPATVVLVQQTGANGSVEHRRQVLAQQRCGNRCLPYCNFCSTHILHSDDQQLYRKCAQIECHRAVIDAGPEIVPTCSAHRNRLALRTLDRVKAEDLVSFHQQRMSSADEHHLQQQLPPPPVSVQPPSLSQPVSQPPQKAQSKSKKAQPKVPAVAVEPGTNASGENDATGKRKKKKATPKAKGQNAGNAEVEVASTSTGGKVDTVSKQLDNKRASRISSSSLNKDEETVAAAQEALTLASVAQDFGFEDHELTEMLIRLPDEAFDGILEPDLARTGPGVITITDSGGGNELGVASQNLVSSSALGVDAIDMAVQAATSSCSHNWADVEQFLLSEGYCGSGAGGVPNAAMANMAGGFFSPPPAYTNLTNAAAVTTASPEQAAAVQFRQSQSMHTQGAPISSTPMWSTPTAPLASTTDNYGNQHHATTDGMTVLLPNMDAYAPATMTTPVSTSILHLVNNIHEQNSERTMAAASASWNAS